MLQCVAVSFAQLVRTHVYCSVLHCGAVWCSVLKFVAVYCRQLQYLAVCCSALQCVAVSSGTVKTLEPMTARCSVVQHVAVCVW